jgi:hypothetical protein
VNDDTTCPLCGSSVNRQSNLRWRKDGFDIVQCHVCGLLYRFDLPTREELEAIYASDYFNSSDGTTNGQGYQDYVADEPLHRLNARRRIDRLDALAGSRGDLLDVGAAAGFFVDEARRDGWAARGIDVAAAMTKVATERLGVDVATTTLAEAPLEAGTFDAITMWDYIEHAVDPCGDLGRAAELLRPGGVVGLSTGDAASAVARGSGARWHLLTPRHHNFFFTRATLTRALDQAGFDVISASHPGAVYPLSYVVYKVQTIARLRFLDRIAASLRGTKLGERALPLNLGDIITVWARRRP